MTNVFAVRRRPSTSNASGPTKRPSPKITSTPRPRKRSGLSLGSMPLITLGDALHHAGEIRLRRSGVERPPVGMSHLVGDARRLEQRLRRHAAVPEAVAAELVLLDERDLGAERRAAGGDDQSARAAADYRQVEFGLRHRVSSFPIGESYTGRRGGMYSSNVQVAHSTWARAAFALVALSIAGFAGCASDLTSTPNHSSANVATYGLFTGEFVDGLPLYRFPPIVVVGSRSSIGRDEMAGDDN